MGTSRFERSYDVAKSDAQTQVKFINDKIARYLRGNMHEPGIHRPGSMDVAKGFADAGTRMLTRTPERAVEIRDLVYRALDAIAKTDLVSFERPEPYAGVNIGDFIHEVPTPFGEGMRWEFDLAGYFDALRARRGW